MQGRNQRLDELRGIAILLVLGRHILVVPEDLPPICHSFFGFWRQIGWIGVDLFFVLSGFLVSGLVFDEIKSTGRFNYKRFLIRRGLRIYPPFYLLLFFSVIASHYALIPGILSPRSFFGEFFFLQNYLGTLWNHTWSLAVEEHFYLLFCFLMVLLMKAGKKTEVVLKFLPLYICFMGISLLALRVIEIYLSPYAQLHRVLSSWILPFTHFRLDSMCAGVLLRWAYVSQTEKIRIVREKHKKLILLIVSACLIWPGMYDLEESRFIYSCGLTLNYIGFAAVLLLFVHPDKLGKNLKDQSLPSHSWLQSIGISSYSIYLWHMMVFYLLAKVFPVSAGNGASFWIHTSLYMMGSILFGFAMFHCLENASLKFRDRYFPSEAVVKRRRNRSDNHSIF